jgi:hypothetical protein
MTTAPVFFITQNSMPPQLLTFGRLNGTGLPPLAISLNEHCKDNGAISSTLACSACEGIVSKRLGSPYR